MMQHTNIERTARCLFACTKSLCYKINARNDTCHSMISNNDLICYISWWCTGCQVQYFGHDIGGHAVLQVEYDVQARIAPVVPARSAGHNRGINCYQLSCQQVPVEVNMSAIGLNNDPFNGAASQPTPVVSDDADH